MSSHREALEDIMRVCYESSNYDRRVQTIHQISMEALGLTLNQRNERHTKALMRSEVYKDRLKTQGRSLAKKQLVEEIENESGIKRMKCKSVVERIL